MRVPQQCGEGELIELPERFAQGKVVGRGQRQESASRRDAATWSRLFETQCHAGRDSGTPLGWPVAGDQFGHAHAEVVVQHEHFTPGNEPAVRIDIDRVACQLI